MDESVLLHTILSGHYSPLLMMRVMGPRLSEIEPIPPDSFRRPLDREAIAVHFQVRALGLGDAADIC